MDDIRAFMPLLLLQGCSNYQEALPGSVMVPRPHLAQSWAHLAMSSSALCFWDALQSCLLAHTPCHHHPGGVEQAQGRCLADCWLLPLQLLLAMGFRGAEQAVSVALSFVNNPAITGLVPPLHLQGKLEGPVSPHGCDSSQLLSAALGCPGSQNQSSGGKRDWHSLSVLPCAPALHFLCPKYCHSLWAP